MKLRLPTLRLRRKERRSPAHPRLRADIGLPPLISARLKRPFTFY